MEFISNDKLKSYIQKVDDKAEDFLDFFLKQVLLFSPTLRDSEFIINQEIIRNGCRIWVRYLNKVDANRIDHIQFVNADDSENGKTGKKFVQLLDNDDQIVGKIKNLQGQSLDVFPYLVSVVPGSQLILGLASLFGGSSNTKEFAVTKEALRLMSELFVVFNQFIDEYSIEYEKQFGTKPVLPFYKEIIINNPLKIKNPINPLNEDSSNNTTTYLLAGLFIFFVLKKKKGN